MSNFMFGYLTGIVVVTITRIAYDEIRWRFRSPLGSRTPRTAGEEKE